MKEVKLRMNEQLKYEEIKKCADGYQSKERTSIKLGITIRQVNKLITNKKERKASYMVNVLVNLPITKDFLSAVKLLIALTKNL